MEPPARTFHTRPARVARAGGEAAGLVALAGLSPLLAFLGWPGTGLLGSLVAAVLAFGRARAALRERAAACPPRLLLDGEGLTVRGFGARVEERLPWEWVGALEPDEAGARLRVTLAPGKRWGKAPPLWIPLGDFRPEDREVLRELADWLRGARERGSLARWLAPGPREAGEPGA